MDTLQHFTFESASIRGAILHLEETYSTIINQREYPERVKKILGEALASCVLLAGTLKFEGELHLQFQGRDPLPLIIVQCDHQLNVRALAQYQEGQDLDYESAFLKGQMALTINQYKRTETYQSIVPIESTSISDNMMHYFAQSEQIPTKIWLAIGENHAAGMLLQLMPHQNTEQREQFWEYAVQIGQTITEAELLTLDNETLLHRLYHETVLRLYDARSVRFKCRCSEDRMKRAMVTLGENELQEMIAEKKYVDVTCEFCNRQFTFDAIDVAMLFR